MQRAVFLVATLLLALALTLAPAASPASATDGSVPAVVSDYISTDLAAALNEFYGPGTDGDGTLFEDSTSYSSTSRVWEWTAEFEAGVAGDTPDRRLNEWVTVVSVRSVVVGVATVSIDPVTNAPQLASYLASPPLAAALAGVPATSRLLRDVRREAWLAVDGEMVTAVVVGRSGLGAPSTVEAYRARVAVQQPALPTAVAQPVSADGLVFVAIAALLVIALLAVERFRRRRAGQFAPDPADHVL